MAHVLALARTSLAPLRERLPDVELRGVRDRPAALRAAAGAVACLAHWQADGVRVDAPLVAALAGTCRLVQSPAAGLDGVDLGACAAAGLPVASAAGANATAVAEWAVWAVLDALGGLAAAGEAMRRGDWRGGRGLRPELRGRRVGVVGMGAVGRALLPRLAGFEVDTGYWTRTRDRALEQASGLRWHELDDLVARSDVLVLAIASTSATRHLLDARRLAALPDGAVVVNAARGEVWDERAVAAALADGTAPLHAVATDVYTAEPPANDHPLLRAPHATTTPHLAGLTRAAIDGTWDRVAANLRRAVDGTGGYEGLVGGA